MALEEYLVSRLEQLASDRDESVKSMATIREKLEQADKKRVGESHDENYLKWSQVYRTLDAQLTKMQAHLTSIDAEIEEKNKKLAECREKAAAEARKRAERLKFILDMPPEEFASLSIEDMELLQEYELGQLTVSEEMLAEMPAAAAPAAQPAEGPVPPTEEPKSAAPETKEQPVTEPHPEQPPHVRALQKIASGDTGSVTLREATALADLDEALIKSPQDDPAVARSRAAVTAALVRIREDCVRLLSKIEHIRTSTSA